MPRLFLPSHYTTLGVSISSTDAEIKAAYRKRALELHPDKNQDNTEEATVLFQELAEAYEALSKHHKQGHEPRRVYVQVVKEESDYEPWPLKNLGKKAKRAYLMKHGKPGAFTGGWTRN